MTQTALDSVMVSWRPPEPLGDTTGYRIHYSSGASAGTSVDVEGASSSEFLLDELDVGVSYTVSLFATSLHIPSENLSQSIELKPGVCVCMHVCVCVCVHVVCVCVCVIL